MKKALFAYMVTASAAMAHSGHEAALREGQEHWLTQSDHLVVVLLGAAVVGLAVARLSIKRLRAARE